ncbi:major facilitator superfamily domain-containing protein 6-like [Denticeps clupeoides]|uniref:Major facilitator superfamily associated domain-containing protein n=1 Tax=Denticeps clupeoides TaxID=299321 RepID=A0AAY4CQP2_9TELE|nr:major facilitator superfamily domain-containing protein 6-like [Denticeps clupeoides]
MKRNHQWDVRSALALAGAFSFLHSCSRACLLPFFTLYLRYLGLSASMVGVVMGTRHLICLVWNPISCLFAKHYDKRRAVIVTSLVCSAGVVLTILLMPPAGGKPDTSHCNVTELEISPTDGTGLYLSKGRQNAAVSLSPDFVSAGTQTLSQNRTEPLSQANTTAPSSPTRQYGMQHEAPVNQTGITGAEEANGTASLAVSLNRRIRSKDQQAHYPFLEGLNMMDDLHQLFFLVLIAVGLWELVSAPLEWTADDMVYDYLDFVDATDHHSRLWLWRLLGGACGVIGAGVLVSSLDCSLFVGARMPRSAAHFFSYSALMLLALPEAAYLPSYLNHKRERRRGAGEALKALQLIRGDARALLCAVTAFLAGAAGAAAEDFLLWQIQDRGGTELHMGVSLGLALCSQVAFPPLTRDGRISRVVGAHSRVLLLGVACRALQCLYYSFLWAPWAALPAQLLDCLSVSAVWWAVGAQCEDVATPGTERAIGRAYQATALHLGAAVGSFTGGFVVQRFGLTALFRAAAAALLVWCLALGLLQWKIPRQRRINYSRLLAAGASDGSDSESEQERDWLEKAMESDQGGNNNNNSTIDNKNAVRNISRR